MKEYAATAVDVLARRLRISFLNVAAAEECLPTVVRIMAEELGWGEDEQKRQVTGRNSLIQLITRRGRPR